MGAWIALTDTETLRNDQNIKAIRDNCRDKLIDLVRASTSNTQTNSGSVLLTVVPKICMAFDGLNRFTIAQPEATTLIEKIRAGQRHDGGWGPLISSNSSTPEMTAIVLRTFGSKQCMPTEIDNGLKYLDNVFLGISNPYIALYVLNTIKHHRHLAGQITREYDDVIRAQVKKVLHRAFYNPTQFPNPINIDFNDGVRTRYIRLQADLILLESLSLASGEHRYYLRGHPGRRIFSHLMENLQKPPEYDTTGHRLTTPAALQIRKCLNLIRNSRDTRAFPAGSQLKAWVVCAIRFGTNVGWNTLALILAAIGIVAAKQLCWTAAVNALYGVSAKTAFDLIRSIVNYKNVVEDK